MKQLGTIRKDTQGNILNNGEYQRKDGRYEYRYKNICGDVRAICATSLDKLRERERELANDVADGIDTTFAKETSLNSFFVPYIHDRQLKESTRDNYKYMFSKYIAPELGSKPIGSIRYSDIVRFYNHLINDCHFKPASMEIVHTIIHPIFQTAVRDGYIRTNPSDGAMTEIKRRHDWEPTKRYALTEDQQASFMEFIKSDERYTRWVPVITVMLGTGMRVGECLGLRWEDIDFKQGLISVNHNLVYRKVFDGTMETHITSPKTKKAVRVIPMFNEVRSALLSEREHQLKTGPCKSVIDGYTHFVFKNRYDSVMLFIDLNHALKRIEEEYNATHDEKLPHISSHILRHTFCTRMCENTSDQNTLKMIQEIMGHADISTTLDIYTDLTAKKKIDAFASLQGKFAL